jgi:hypothetical protein
MQTHTPGKSGSELNITVSCTWKQSLVVDCNLTIPVLNIIHITAASACNLLSPKHLPARVGVLLLLHTIPYSMYLL